MSSPLNTKYLQLVCFQESRPGFGEYLAYLGISIDGEANAKRGEEVVISIPESSVKVLVVPTNEELAIARETVALL